MWASLVSWFRLLHRPDRSRKTALCSWTKFCTTSALTDASRTYSVNVRNPAVLALWRTMSYCRALYLTVTARLFFCTLLDFGRPPLFFGSIVLLFGGMPGRVGYDDFASARSKARRPTGGFQHLKTQPRYPHFRSEVRIRSLLFCIVFKLVIRGYTDAEHCHYTVIYVRLIEPFLERTAAYYCDCRLLS